MPPNLDKELLFSDAQTIAAVASTIASTNTVDMGAAATDIIGNTITRDWGRSDLELLCQVVVAVLSAGAATIEVDVITSASADLSTPTIVCSSQVIAKATLVVGYKFRLFIPFGLTQRYLGLQYTIGTATTTAGKITACIVGHVPTVFVG